MTQTTFLTCGGVSGNYGDIIIGCPIGTSQTGNIFQFIRESIGKFVTTAATPTKFAGLSGFKIFLIFFGFAVLTLLIIFTILKFRRKKKH